MKNMLLALVLMGYSLVSMANELPNFDKLWDYGNPAQTEVKFRALLPEAEASGDKDYFLQLLTQIARTNSLQKKFAEAHNILDSVEKQLESSTPTAEIRYLLERGRTFNSAKAIPEAMALFLKAYALGVERRLDFHAIDAAHMVAIAERDPAAQMEWNLKAVRQAEQSADPRAQGWLGSLYNNIGWTHHDSGKFTEALEIFQKALAFREEKRDPGSIRIAKWCIGRTFRSLQRFSEALAVQRALEAEFIGISSKDGYVYEELAELLLLTGSVSESKKYFGLAFEELSQDIWLKENESKRLERLKELSL